MKIISLALLLTTLTTTAVLGQPDTSVDKRKLVDELISEMDYFYQVKKDSTINGKWLGFRVHLMIKRADIYYEVEIRPIDSADAFRDRVQSTFEGANTLDGGYYWYNGWAPSHLIRYEEDRGCYVFYEPYPQGNSWE